MPLSGWYSYSRMETESQDPHDFELLSRELVLSSLVHEVTRVMLSSPNQAQALKSFLLGTMELTGVQNMILFGIRQGQAELETIDVLGLAEETAASLKPTLAGGPMYASLASNRHILVEEPASDDPFRAADITSYLVMPITAPAPADQKDHFRLQPIAILWLDTSPPASPLTAQAISHLTGLAQQAGLMMENFRVQKELAAANQELQSSHAQLNLAYAALSRAQSRIEEDLDRARAIQNSLLPTAFPTHLLRRVASKYIPAGKVGGDYYDCFEMTAAGSESGSLGIVIADVSGHGIAASLVMSMFKVLLRNYSALEKSPCAVLNRINTVFMSQFGGRHFVTAYYAVFDKASRRLTWCNAGHVPQYLAQGAAGGEARLEEMASQGLVLGIFANTFLRDATLDLADEARLLLYTDGITEAHGPAVEEGAARKGPPMFGPEPVKELALSALGDHPAAVIDELMRRRDAFMGADAAKAAASPETFSFGDETNYGDDATLVILDL
jgi:serine phosphatase RsbU (regulator of sigma subunit)